MHGASCVRNAVVDWRTLQLHLFVCFAVRIRCPAPAFARSDSICSGAIDSKKMGKPSGAPATRVWGADSEDARRRAVASLPSTQEEMSPRGFEPATGAAERLARMQAEGGSGLALNAGRNVPERIRTSGLRLRKPTLYPAELRGRCDLDTEFCKQVLSESLLKQPAL